MLDAIIERPIGPMPEYMKRLEVAERLNKTLDTAYADYLMANARFDALAKETPSETPHPDGSLRIHQAGAASRAAFQNYLVALKEFTDFSLNWTPPQ